VIVEFIDAHREEHGVEPICEQLQIAPSTYYAHRTRPPPARSVTDAATTAVIEKVHAQNFGVYGARKVHAQLHRQGHPVARCTVERLMRDLALRGISRDKTRKTTVAAGAETERPADLVERQFVAAAPNQLWVADLTYVRTICDAGTPMPSFPGMRRIWQVVGRAQASAIRGDSAPEVARTAAAAMRFVLETEVGR
jgi:putative transposase